MIKKTAVQKAFDQIFVERVFKVAWNKARADEIFLEADNKRTIAFNLLSETLTTERQRHLLDELECAWNFAEGLMQEYAYRQGLQDSQMIHKELSELGISVTKESII